MPKKICDRFLIILPPSNGYMGRVLNIRIKKFEYKINSVGIINISSLSSIIKNIIKIKFVLGPARATMIFFITSKFAFNIFLLKFSVSILKETIKPRGNNLNDCTLNPNNNPDYSMSGFHVIEQKSLKEYIYFYFYLCKKK